MYLLLTYTKQNKNKNLLRKKNNLASSFQKGSKDHRKHEQLSMEILGKKGIISGWESSGKSLHHTRVCELD